MSRLIEIVKVNNSLTVVESEISEDLGGGAGRGMGAVQGWQPRKDLVKVKSFVKGIFLSILKHYSNLQIILYF